MDGNEQWRSQFFYEIKRNFNEKRGICFDFATIKVIIEPHEELWNLHRNIYQQLGKGLPKEGKKEKMDEKNASPGMLHSIRYFHDMISYIVTIELRETFRA